ncbi:hypothetical protein ACIGB6_19560 [Paeniglutamicibacter gangotriensis]|uniref:Uncharacterized protein n=1 Tax=Paeniglutamicibacter gangotriensis Lz1y TaxID=1276920 RepID=M7MYA6_9MICC|nr:hypothetical protein [Paeniglutamicibacter gangotriensis]EMQ99930.1 hypothetical protein ADIAG_01036 [Paeniglutamicibacter gangotriensis Lz1y]
MDRQKPSSGAVGPIMVGAMPKLPRRVLLEAKTLAEALGATVGLGLCGDQQLPGRMGTQ